LRKEETKAEKGGQDEQLPKETKRAETYGVRKTTVRQALQDPAELEYIRRERGRGTFISRRKFDEGPRELTSFTEEMRRHALSPTSRILGQRIVEADARSASALRLPPKSRVFVLKRVRLADGEPISVQTAHIPSALVPGLRLDGDASLYEVLQSRYQLHPVRARESYSAAAATAAMAELLGVPA